MITLRELVKSDKAIASITTEECKFIALALSVVHDITSRRLFKWLIPKEVRDRALDLKMLSACFGRTPEERQPIQLTEQIRLAMNKDK